MEISFSHKDVSTTTTVKDQVLDRCFLQTETKNEFIHLKAFQVEADSFSFLVNYQTFVECHHGNLDGHIFMIGLVLPYRVVETEHTIPKQYLVSQETCFDHVMIVLSEMHLPSHIQERIVRYISTESVKFSRGRGGFRVQVNVKVGVDRLVRVEECRCRDRERPVAREVTEMDCPICLTDLSSAVSRIELWCSHVFHTGCVIMWLDNNHSCPICRAKILGETICVF